MKFEYIVFGSAGCAGRVMSNLESPREGVGGGNWNVDFISRISMVSFVVSASGEQLVSHRSILHPFNPTFGLCYLRHI